MICHCDMMHVNDISMIHIMICPPQDEIDHSHSMTYQVFPTLSDWISSFLKNNSDMIASNVGNNMLVKQVPEESGFIPKSLISKSFFINSLYPFPFKQVLLYFKLPCF